MKRWIIRFLGLMLITMALSCTPKNVSQGELASGKSKADLSREAIQQNPESRWESTVAAAKKEGKVVVFLTAGAEPRLAITKSFYDRFGIVVDVVSGSGGELVQKLIRERNAGLFAADVFIGGTTTPIINLKPVGILDPIKPVLMLPDLTDPELIKKTWYGGDLMWVDIEKKYHLAFLAFVSSDMAVNTNLVNPEVDLKSYKDLLNPKWKGRIVQHDPTIAGNGSKWFAIFGSKILGFDYIRELINQNPTITRDHNLIGTWLAQGKFAVAMSPKPEVITDLAKQGAPVKAHFPVEGGFLTCGSGSIVLINRAPHPNAAVVLINWLLSREGNKVFSDSYGGQSARLDVPTESFSSAYNRRPGVNYYNGEQEESLVKAPEFYEMAKQMYAPLLK